MWKPHYQRRYSNKKADPIEGILILYVLYLVFLWTTDKAMFWQWLNFGIFIALIFFGGLMLIKKIRNIGDNNTYERKRRYFINSDNTQSSNTHLPTLKAAKLAYFLRNKFGWNVKLEESDGHKRPDISIPEAKMNIEIDGSQHNLNTNQALRDQMRDYYSSKEGIDTKRIPNSLLKDDRSVEEQANFLNKILKERISKLKE